MTWEKVLKEGQCKIDKCLATKCKHNENQNCTLNFVIITSDAKCQQFTRKEGYSAGGALRPNPRTRVQVDTDEYSYQMYDEA